MSKQSSKKKLGRPIIYHDEFHRIQREIMRKYYVKKRRERQRKRKGKKKGS